MRGMGNLGASMLSVDEARERVRAVALAHPMSNERVPLEECSGRLLADNIRAPFDVPGYVNSAMDGFAVRGADLSADGETRLRLSGEILAGGTQIPVVEAGACVRITTGAPVPAGADTVVMKENTRVEGDCVVIAPGTAHGANVRPAGEDYASGDAALSRGDVLSPSRIAVLASFGFTHANVTARPSAMLFTTGDELIAPGRERGYGQVFDSNRYSIGGLIEQNGAKLLAHERLRDDPPALIAALKRAGERADIIVTSGGVSAGEADFLPNIVAEIGKVYFWKVRIKPGMPFLFGHIGNALLFALPGNPVSGIATFLTLVRPSIAAMTGARDPWLSLSAKLGAPLMKKHGRAEFLRARLACNTDGQLVATPLAKQGSGMLRGAADADALILVPEETRTLQAGDVVQLLPMPGWQG
jgi:molybdopterin molybdotransferase